MLSLKTLQGYPINVDAKCTLGESDAKVYCAKYDWEDKYIAAGPLIFFRILYQRNNFYLKLVIMVKFEYIM